MAKRKYKSRERIEILHNEGHYWARVVNFNGQIEWTTETYSRKEDAAIRAERLGIAAEMPVIDLTDKEYPKLEDTYMRKLVRRFRLGLRSRKPRKDRKIV